MKMYNSLKRKRQKRIKNDTVAKNKKEELPPFLF